MANDPTAKAILKDGKVSMKEIRESAKSVASIRVYGSKQ
jgi:hypothetical protein